MTFYIAFVATLNLCLGYALGAGKLPKVKLPTLRKKKEVNGQAETVAEPPQPAAAPQPAATETAAAEALPEAATTAPAEEAAKAETSDTTTPTAGDANTSAKPDTKQILAGLAAFRAKLDTVGNDLRNAEDDDRETIDDCAEEIRKANDDYLEIAHETIETLDDSDEKQAEFKTSLSNQAQTVRDATGEIDEILTHEDTIAVCERLLSSADELTESAVKVHQDFRDTIGAESDDLPPEDTKPDEPSAEAEQLQPKAPVESSESAAEKSEEEPAEEPTEEPTEQAKQEPAPPPEAEADPLVPKAVNPVLPEARDGLVSLERVEQLIDGYLADEMQTAPLQVATLMLDEKAAAEGGTEFDEKQAERMLMGLGKIVEQELADGQLAALDGNGKLLMVLLGDDKELATQRCEQTRQQVAGSKFKLDGQGLEVTVSCAVADTSDDSDKAKVLERLEASLGEASRYGANRTFHHDGNFPAPVVPLDVEINPLELEV